jgi:hypothetical protein
VYTKSSDHKGLRTGVWVSAGCGAAFCLAIYYSLTFDIAFAAGNDASRFALIESTVDLGHAYIDGSRFAWTTDRVRLNEHEYSNKPPLLALVGAAVYWILKNCFGLSFATSQAATIKALTVALVGLPTAALIGCFHYALAESYPRVSAAYRWLTTATLAFGTILTSYVGTLSSHPISALLVFVACWCTWRAQSVIAGLAVGLLCCIEPVPGGVFLIATAVMTYRRSRATAETTTRSEDRHVPGRAKRPMPDQSVSQNERRNLTPNRPRTNEPRASRGSLLKFFLPVGLGGALFGLANLATVGSVLLPKMVPGAQDFGSGSEGSLLGVWLPDSAGYPISCLFGWHGFFTVSPVLLLGAWGLLLAARSGRPLQAADAWTLCAAIVVMIAGHILFVGAFGGWSYGFRYLIPIIPLLVFFCPLAIEVIHGSAFVTVLSVSIVFALVGAYHPWPPGYELEATKDEITAVVTNPVGGNVTAFIASVFPDSCLAGLLAERYISRDPGKQAAYLQVFFMSKGDIGKARRIGEQFARQSAQKSHEIGGNRGHMDAP